MSHGRAVLADAALEVTALEVVADAADAPENAARASAAAAATHRIVLVEVLLEVLLEPVNLLVNMAKRSPPLTGGRPRPGWPDRAQITNVNANMFADDKYVSALTPCQGRHSGGMKAMVTGFRGRPKARRIVGLCRKRRR
jgi:hypothetical protein